MNERNILVVAHAHREDTVIAAMRVIEALREAGATPVLAPEDRVDLAAIDARFADIASTTDDIGELELAIVLGGDGTILRACELTHGTATPLLGVNLGHVGFLAEAESEEVDTMIDRVVARRWSVDERLTLDVSVFQGKERVASTWALNEASVEKAARSRMLEVVVEVDGKRFEVRLPADLGASAPPRRRPGRRTATEDTSSHPDPDAPGAVTAPMPGTVAQVAVADGDRVAEGDVLVVLEAMKMEHPVAAPHAGTVTALAVEAGATVAAGQPLLTLRAG